MEKDILNYSPPVMFRGTPCMFTFCLFTFWLLTVVLSKTRKLQYTNRVNLSVLTVQCSVFVLQRHLTHLHSNLLFSINKILADIWLLKLVISKLIHNKDDIEFVTKFPCLLGHLVKWNKLNYFVYTQCKQLCI